MQSDSFHIGICAKTFYIKRQFIIHLQENYDVKLTSSSSACLDPDISQKAHMGGNSQKAF